MRLDQERWSEFDFVRHLQGAARTFSQGLQTGIGDDCAVISCGPDQDLLVTTDLLVEGIHFERRWFSLFQIGAKALRVSLSDIAAMGGAPEYAFVSLALPPSLSAREGAKILDGVRESAECYEVALAGGDLSRSAEGIVLDSILLGKTEKGTSLLRSGAEPGDQLFVSGTLGEAALGLELMKMEKEEKRWAGLLERQRSPEPRLELGRILREKGWATAMMDLSDGISIDLARLCEASDVGAVLRLHDLPASVLLRAASTALARDPASFLLHGGEDYELLFTVPADARSALEQADLPLSVTPVGEILPSDAGVWLEDPDGRRPLLPQGYDHFR